MSERPSKFGNRVTVSVTNADYDILNSIAGREDVSVSWVVRRALEEYLRPHRNERRGRIGISATRRAPSAKHA